VKLKKVVRARMVVTGESYVTALMRIRECKGATVETVSNIEALAAETIRRSPPRIGK
jgi:hypothetical protein